MTSTSASGMIDKQIGDLEDWRGKTLARLRRIVHDADPAISEEWKWGTGVYSHHGMVLAATPFKGTLKLNFFQGASLPDPNRLFNAGLEAKKTRAIDFHESDGINEAALKELIRAAVAYNSAVLTK